MKAADSGPTPPLSASPSAASLPTPQSGAGKPAMLTTQQALDILLAAAAQNAFDASAGVDHDRQPNTEWLATEDANGRVLAEDIVSPIDVPPMDVSSMDGYAVRCADFFASSGGYLTPGSHMGGTSAATAQDAALQLPISQRIPAGAAPVPLAAGTAARIFTGAPLPAGADAVVIQEDAQEAMPEGGPDAAQKVPSTAASAAASVSVSVGAPAGIAHGKAGRAVVFQAGLSPQSGQWINRRGADIAAGATILRAGTRLSAQALGLAASVGVARVRVARRLKVALLFTGDELKRPGEPLVPGAIYNSNRYTLGGLLANLGCEITDFGVIADRLDATRAALREAAASHDLVLTCGGVSVGEEDHVKPAVEAEGRLDMWKIAMKPGKPLAFGTLRAPSGDEPEAVPPRNAWFVGLPGNPVSTFVTFMIFVRPFLLRLQGVTDVAPRAFQARADFTLKGDRRNEFLRVRLNAEGGLDVYPTQSSAVLTSTVWGDGLVDNPPGQAIRPGDMVRFMPFSALLY